MFIEMTVEEAMKLCGKNTKVLVAVKNLENEEDTENVFVKKTKKDYDELFQDAKTVAALFDDFFKQLQLYNVKQDIYNVKSKGIQKTILLRI